MRDLQEWDEAMKRDEARRLNEIVHEINARRRKKEMIVEMIWLAVVTVPMLALIYWYHFVYAIAVGGR